MTIKKGDFIEIDYTASLLEEGSVFDTTNPDEAEKAGMICDHDHNHEVANEGHVHLKREDFKPVKICVGEGHVLPGLDEHLIGIGEGAHEIILGEENAFGKKDSKLLKLMPLSAFKKQKINPFPGLTVDMDGSRGLIRSVSGGRVIIDFNHPLSGKSVKYAINIKRKIDDVIEKAEALLLLMRFPFDKVLFEEETIKIRVSFELPETAVSSLKEDMQRVLGKKVLFVFEKGSSNKKEVKEVKEVEKEEKEAKEVKEVEKEEKEADK